MLGRSYEPVVNTPCFYCRGLGFQELNSHMPSGVAKKKKENAKNEKKKPPKQKHDEIPFSILSSWQKF